MTRQPSKSPPMLLAGLAVNSCAPAAKRSLLARIQVFVLLRSRV